ncbi:MAG TPA: ATP-dependent DNA helicase RecG [Candidatus Saccharimonadales bacterium]|nr:ATP-dependent DNA helicase RecG [Candidatus Saccharimonadales bacterium]
MGPSTSIAQLKGVGPDSARKLASLGITTVADLIAYFPRRYDDYSQVLPIKQIVPGAVTIQIVIKQVSGRYVRRGMHITEAIASDATGSVRLVWFNQPYRERAIRLHEPYYVSGQYLLRRQRFAILNPSIELVSSFPLNTARIVPIYREAKGISSLQIRRLLQAVLPIIDQQPETLPDWLARDAQLMDRGAALRAIHFPDNAKQLSQAQTRLGFEEVFELSLASLLNKYELQRDMTISIPFDQQLARDFVAGLPFRLTDAQRRAVWDIYKDMAKSQPMNRLIEGDVGSGKTVVATMAAVMAMSRGYQVAFMAPTELLARQHAETISSLLEPLGMHLQVTLLTGSIPLKQKALAYKHISQGHAQCTVGTQALLQEAVRMPKLALVVVDEQHRFGVQQRKALMAKAGLMPHLLSLTATPIPRSLALTLYGELDVSILDSKPAGRQSIMTKICSPNSNSSIYAAIEEQLQSGRQMFVVCPSIADSETLQIRSVEKVFAELSKGAFRKWRIGMLHGKMKSDEKAQLMDAFVGHTLDILVSTTVIEVGVDVPNASVMLIEGADRFGLAQLHQLRGRVGRGLHQGYCYLMMSDSSAPTERLRALERSTDGFRLAELDLSLRGPGAIYGTMQHGQLDLRMASLNDVQLIAKARHAAQACIDRQLDLSNYPYLQDRVTRLRTVTNLN